MVTNFSTCCFRIKSGKLLVDTYVSLFSVLSLGSHGDSIKYKIDVTR